MTIPAIVIAVAMPVVVVTPRVPTVMTVTVSIVVIVIPAVAIAVAVAAVTTVMTTAVRIPRVIVQLINGINAKLLAELTVVIVIVVIIIRVSTGMARRVAVVIITRITTGVTIIIIVRITFPVPPVMPMRPLAMTVPPTGPIEVVARVRTIVITPAISTASATSAASTTIPRGRRNRCRSRAAFERHDTGHSVGPVDLLGRSSRRHG
jgi:hypothetical protein